MGGLGAGGRGRGAASLMAEGAGHSFRRRLFSCTLTSDSTNSDRDTPLLFSSPCCTAPAVEASSVHRSTARKVPDMSLFPLLPTTAGAFLKVYFVR